MPMNADFTMEDMEDSVSMSKMLETEYQRPIINCQDLKTKYQNLTWIQKRFQLNTSFVFSNVNILKDVMDAIKTIPVNGGK